MRHLRNLYDLSSDDVGAILDRSVELKTAHRNGDRPDVLRGRMLSLLFEKPSLRTRVSFMGRFSAVRPQRATERSRWGRSADDTESGSATTDRRIDPSHTTLPHKKMFSHTTKT